MLPVLLHTSTVAVSSCLLKGMDPTKEISEFKEKESLVILPFSSDTDCVFFYHFPKYKLQIENTIYPSAPFNLLFFVLYSLAFVTLTLILLQV